ncbi:MAG: hypothetical protein LQ345_003493 [Seirophora villosa]|nr:MAG: hypothetical protein LQ345_003493 [Seirophora villosa]
MAISRPQILYLRLGNDTQAGIFDDLYQNVRARVASLASTQEATSMAIAQSLLSTQSFKIVLVVDGGISVKKHNALQKQLASYATVGGTVIFCCIFSGFVRPPDMSKLWKNFNEPWASGDYHRSTFYLSQRMKNVFGSQRARSLLSEYSMKALHLANVPVGSRVYVPLEQSRTESRVFPPTAVDNSQTPAAFHKYGDGWLGYIGDVNNENGSQALLMAMLGKSNLKPIRWRQKRLGAYKVRFCAQLDEGCTNSRYD